MRIKHPRQKNEAHLRFVRGLPCIVSGRTDGVEAAHIRYGEPRYAKRPTGMGEKPSDIFCVPLHHEWHRTGPKAQHRSGEREFWKRHSIDPCLVALALWAHSGDQEAGEMIVSAAKRGLLAGMILDARI